MLGRLWTTWGVLNRTHGFSLKPLLTFAGLTAYRSFVGATAALDHVLFPAFRRQRIDRPIFVIGNPRSGTTFLQRFLVRSGEVASFELWQMLVPSITGQKLLRPLVPRLAALNPAKHHGSKAHQTGLDSIETDDVALAFRFFDGLFPYAYFLAWDDRDHFDDVRRRFDNGSPVNDRDLRYYSRCVQRNLHHQGKGRALGKPFTFSMRVDDVLRHYPDARFIYLVRDPAAVIPSGMSLLRGVLEKQFGISKLPEETRQRYFERLYDGECYLYRSFYEAYKDGRIPEQNLLVVRYPDIMQRFEHVMAEIEAFAELPISEEYRRVIAETARKQRAHVSKHKYDLAEFGLSAERIHSDLDFVYREFRPDGPAGADRAA